MKNIKRRHIGLFVSNVIAAIRGKTRKRRFLRPQFALRPVASERLLNYNHVLQNSSTEKNQIPYRKSNQRQPAFSGIRHQHQDQPSATRERNQPFQDGLLLSFNILVYLNGNNAAEGENNIKYANSYPMN